MQAMLTHEIIRVHFVQLQKYANARPQIVSIQNIYIKAKMIESVNDQSQPT